MVESGPGGQHLAAGAWQRLEALPDPRSPRGRIYPLACLIAVAVCAFTAAGNDRFTAVGQWIKRAGQADLARLRAPWDPISGQYRAPDEKTIRVVLDRLDPRALTRALLGPGPLGRRCEPSPVSVRDYHARRAAQQAKALARDRLRAVAVDGKTSRGARRADGTRVHLLGVAEHGGRLLDHVEVDVKHNETSHFTALLEPLDLDGAVVTFDALHTVRANMNWLATEKKGHYIAVVKKNQPLLHARVRALPWRQVPAGSTTREAGHGRTGTRTLKAAHASGLDFPGARQAIKITRWRKDTATGKTSRETVYAVTSLTSADATPQDLARLVREHWSIEVHHHIRDLTFGEDTSTSRTGSGPANLATIRAAITAAIKDAGYLHIPEGRRDHTTPAETLRLYGFD
ncbi:MAG: ISAs1 family transposase [Actinomycetota bacterium]|nr:ISAs1 family transposase [Actinomycetota bacterium]